MSHEGGSRGWPKVQALVRQLEPKLIELFRRHGVPPTPAGAMLEEAVTLLLYRWEEVANPEAWLFEVLEFRLEQLDEAADEPSSPAEAT